MIMMGFVVKGVMVFGVMMDGVIILFNNILIDMLIKVVGMLVKVFWFNKIGLVNIFLIVFIVLEVFFNFYMM